MKTTKEEYEQEHPLLAKAVREGAEIKKANRYRFCERCCGNCGRSKKAYDHLRTCDLMPYVRLEDGFMGFHGAYVDAVMVCDKWKPSRRPKVR